MRLGLHFCDDSAEAREERRAAGKKYINCVSQEEQLKYFDKYIVNLDTISQSPTLGRNSKEILGPEKINMHYSSHIPRSNINYNSFAFSVSEIRLEDHWLVQFIPSMADRHKFLKYSDMFPNRKAYGSDGMNNYG